MGFILSVGFWAKPTITNKTIRLRRKKYNPINSPQ